MLLGIIWLEMQTTGCPWSFEVDLDFLAWSVFQECLWLVPPSCQAGCHLSSGCSHCSCSLERTSGIHNEIPLSKYLH